MCEDSLNQDDLDYVQLRTSFFINDFVSQAWAQLRVIPRKFRYETRPFSLDALRTLRRYILFHHSGISIQEIVQTKGGRGGKVKEWQMQVKETAAFQAFINLGWPAPNGSTFGSARAFTDTMLAAWLPPLKVTLRATDPTGECNTKCTWSMSSGSITEHGVAFSPGFDFAPSNLRMAKRYLAIHVARVQQARILKQQLAAPPPPPPPQNGLVTTPPGATPPPVIGLIGLLSHGLLHLMLGADPLKSRGADKVHAMRTAN
jgi:hypothetical protein